MEELEKDLFETEVVELPEDVEIVDEPEVNE